MPPAVEFINSLSPKLRAKALRAIELLKEFGFRLKQLRKIFIDIPMKTTNFDDLLAENLKDHELKKAYDALEEEFEVAKSIIHLRHNAGMTQQELARQAHTSQAAISRLESGTYQNVSLAFLRRVGAVLGVKPHVSFQ